MTVKTIFEILKREFIPCYRWKKIPSILMLCLCLTAIAFGDDGRKHQTVKPSIPDVEWDAVFSRTEGWTGGDVAGSVDLGDGRTVWMFGDSWIGKVAEGKHAPGSHMVNNAIGVLKHSHLGQGRAPRYKELEFFWGPNNEKGDPTAWIVPQARSETHWFWSNGGGVVVPQPKGKPKLILFLFHVTKKGDGGGSWNFKTVGTAMAIVDNMQKPAIKWKVRQVLTPYDIGTNKTDRQRSVRKTNWGVAAVLRNKKDGKSFVYIYGIHVAQPSNKQLMLARVSSDHIEKLDRWRFFAGGNRWSSRLKDAVPIAEKMASEMSVDEYVENGRTTFLMVQSQPVFGRDILVRTAPNPQGPWSKPKSVYTVPGLDRGKEYFTYAAKGHLHLSRKNELLVSYIINANSFWDAAIDASIYRPRFIRVPLDRVLPEKTKSR